MHFICCKFVQHLHHPQERQLLEIKFCSYKERMRDKDTDVGVLTSFNSRNLLAVHTVQLTLLGCSRFFVVVDLCVLLFNLCHIRARRLSSRMRNQVMEKKQKKVAKNKNNKKIRNLDNFCLRMWIYSQLIYIHDVKLFTSCCQRYL